MSQKKKSIWEAYDRMYNDVHDAIQHDKTYEKIGNVNNLIEKDNKYKYILRCTNNQNDPIKDIKVNKLVINENMENLI